jgi:hypothetical protein
LEWAWRLIKESRSCLRFLTSRSLQGGRASPDGTRTIMNEAKNRRQVVVLADPFSYDAMRRTMPCLLGSLKAASPHGMALRGMAWFIRGTMEPQIYSRLHLLMVRDWLARTVTKSLSPTIKSLHLRCIYVQSMLLRMSLVGMRRELTGGVERRGEERRGARHRCDDICVNNRICLLVGRNCVMPWLSDYL